MAVIEDYILCILAGAVICWEAYLVARRNRTIKLKGKDDFFTLCLIMAFTMLFLEPELDATLLESVRSTLVLLALFGTLTVKRGISDRGVEKLGFVIRWDQITAIQVEPYLTNKLVVYFQTEKFRFKLFFRLYELKKLVYELQQYYPKVMLAESLQIK